MTNQVNEVLEKIREVCDLKRLDVGCRVSIIDKDNFPYSTGVVVDVKGTIWMDGFHTGEFNPNARHTVSNSVIVIGLPVQLNHLLWALERPVSVDNDGIIREYDDLNVHMPIDSVYNLQKSVEDNLRSSPELTKWVHGVIINSRTPDKIADDIINDTQSDGFCSKRRAQIIKALTQHHQDLMKEVVEKLESAKKDEVKWKKAKYDVKSVEAVCYNRGLTEAQTIIKSK